MIQKGFDLGNRVFHKAFCKLNKHLNVTQKERLCLTQKHIKYIRDLNLFGKVRTIWNKFNEFQKNRMYTQSKFDRNQLYCKLPIERIQNNDYQRFQIITELIDVKEWNSYVLLLYNNDLETLSTICVQIK